MIGSYPSVYQIGHRCIANLFDGAVVVQEKVDGSQISFGIIDGELQVRSKNKQILLDAPEKMFARAVDVIRSLPLERGWVYRGEYLSQCKQNCLVYGRTPKNNIILFDVNTGVEEYVSPDNLVEAAKSIGLESVPCFFSGMILDLAQLKGLLDQESCLGNTKIEGVVIKNYSQMTLEKKVAMGKYVREDFQEENKANWRRDNPTGKDIEQQIIERYRTPARWAKALQHLREEGRIEGSPKDIGALIREAPEDILKEYEQEIRDTLFRYHWGKIKRGVTAGLAEWYKDELAKSAFDGPPTI